MSHESYKRRYQSKEYCLFSSKKANFIIGWGKKREHKVIQEVIKVMKLADIEYDNGRGDLKI